MATARVSQFGIETLEFASSQTIRVSAHGIETLDKVPATIRVSQFGHDLAHTPTWPDQASLSITNIGINSADLVIGGYSHPQGLNHTRSQYIVATSSGLSTGTQVVNVTVTTSSYPATTLLAYTASSLGSSTPYFAVARTGSSANWGYFSAVSTFITADQVAPATPTIDSTHINQDTVVLLGGTYVSSGSTAHFASQWRIATSSNMSGLVYTGTTDFYNLTQITLSVLNSNTSYWADVRYRGNDTNYSARATPHNFVTTSSTASQPSTPTMTATPGITSVAMSGSAFTASSGSDTHIQSHWRATGATDRVIDGEGWELFSTSLLLASTASGLTEGSTGGADVRYQQSNGVWSEWSTLDPYTLSGSTSFDDDTGFRITFSNPAPGEVMTQSTTIQWTPIVTNYRVALAYSTDEGLTWTTISTGSTGGSLVFDFTTLADGPGYTLRGQPWSTGTTAAGEFTYQHFVVNANGTQTNVYVDLAQVQSESGLTNWTEMWNIPGYLWSQFNNDGGIYGVTGTASSQGPFKGLRRDAAGEGLDWDVTGYHLLGNGEGGFSWDRYWSAELIEAGVALQMSGVTAADARGFSLTFEMFPIGAFGTCDNIGKGDLSLNLTYQDGNGGSTGVTKGVGSGHVLVRSCNKIPFYTTRLRVVTKQINPDGTRDYIAKGLIFGRGVLHSTASDLWHIESTFTNIEEVCGGVGYCHTQTRFGGNNAFSFAAALSATRVDSGFEEVCSTDLAEGYWEGKQVWVEDADGTFQQLTNLGGKNWVVDASWEYDINQPAGQARVSAFREICSTDVSVSKSLAPLMENSVYNVDANSSYAELIAPGRDILIYHACVPCSAAPSGLSTGSTSWVLSFDGTIDLVDWGASQYESRVNIEARSQDSNLIDRWIEEPKTYSTDTELEDLIQAIINDNFSTDYSITLFSESGTTTTPIASTESPGWLVNAPIEIERGSLLAALRNLSFQIGWELKYRRPSAGSRERHRFTLYQPARGSTAVYDTWGSSEYIEVPSMSKERADVRNVVQVAYTSTSGQVQFVTGIDPTSVSRYRRRFMLLDETVKSNIDTSSEATRLLNAALQDLGEPVPVKSINTLCYPLVDFNQSHLFSANNVHYNRDKVLAVTGWRHENKVDSVRTHIDLIDDSKLGPREYIIREGTPSTSGTESTGGGSSSTSGGGGPAVPTQPYIQSVSLSRTDPGDCPTSGWLTYRVGWTISTVLTTSDAYTVWVYRNRNGGAWSNVASFIDDAGTTGGYTDQVSGIAHSPDPCTPVDGLICDVQYRYRVRLLEVTGFVGNQFISTQDTAPDEINELTCEE